MNTLVPFINREEERDIIEAAIRAYGKRKLVYVRADGGIGKTRLLKQVEHWVREIQTTRTATNLTIAVVNEFVDTEWGKQFMTGVLQQTIATNTRLISTDANFDIDQMASNLEDIIDQAPDAIIIRLGDSEKLRPGIEKALSRKIKVLTVDNDLDIEGLTCRITTDEHIAAYKALKLLADDIDHCGKVAALAVQEIVPQNRRKKLFYDTLSNHSRIELIPSFVKRDEDMNLVGYQAMNALLNNHPDLKAIWVTWDECARGVIRALKDRERSDIGVYSFDFLSKEDLALMRDPKSPWRATVAINPTDVGRETVQLAIQAVSNMTIKAYYTMPMKLIKQSEVQKKGTTWASIWGTFQPRHTTKILIPDILDFDDYALRDSLVFAHRIADLLDPQHFKSFFEKLHDLQLGNPSGCRWRGEKT
jgi:simple sugar transport system substrate-binding protein